MLGHHSIRTRMTVAFTLAMATVLLASGAGMVKYLKYSAKRQADTVLAATAGRVQQEWTHGERDLGEMAEDAGTVEGEHVAIVIVDPQGRVLAQTVGTVPAWPLAGDDSWRTATAPLGSNTAVAALPWTRVEQSFRHLALVLLIFSGVISGATAVGAWILVGHTLSPIGLLSRQAQAASVDSLRLRLKAPSGDLEVVELVGTLNGLLERLTATAAVRERFYAAASHELRTPLQALSGHLELALSRPRSAPEYQAALGEAYGQTRRLIALVQGLLLLNQLDAATSQPPAERLDLTEYCERALTQFEPLALERNLRVSADLSHPLEIMVPPQHLDMLLRNVIENAVKYGAHGGAVSVRLCAGRDDTTLEVYNDCPPVPDWESDKYFEPFYRPDSSRNSQTGGNGLGLAICKAIATTNGWTLTRRRMEGGVAVAVSFPERG